MRSDRMIECYPTLSREGHQTIEYLAAVKGISKTKCAGQIAHYCLWNRVVLDQLQPYFQFSMSLGWDAHASDNCFHVWLPDRKSKAIQPVIRALRTKGNRLKFRLNQEDRRRLQVFAYTLGVTKVDSLWPVLFPLVLLDGRSLWNLTQNRDIVMHGFHPLLQEWVEARSWGATKTW